MMCSFLSPGIVPKPNWPKERRVPRARLDAGKGTGEAEADEHDHDCDPGAARPCSRVCHRLAVGSIGRSPTC